MPFLAIGRHKRRLKAVHALLTVVVRVCCLATRARHPRIPTVLRVRKLKVCWARTRCSMCYCDLCYLYTPVVPARGGAEVALGIYIELACAVRQPGPCMRALCEAVALMLSKCHDLRATPGKATPSERFPHTSECALHTLHFALHTCASRSTLHFISNHVS